MLKNLDQWVCWRYEQHPSRKKAMKTPYHASTGQRASVQDPQTWNSFEVAYQHYYQGDRYDGLGIVLTKRDDIAGVDIDHCIDDAGDLQPIAQDVITLVDSYSEISPSQHGIRIFARADLKDFGGRRKGAIELYNFGRYLTVTGEHLPGTPRDVQPRLPELRQLYRQYLMPDQSQLAQQESRRQQKPVEQTDNQVLERMFSGKRGELYQQIFEGNTSAVYGSGAHGTPDESRADVLLFNALAFYTYQDAEQMKRILLSSPRARQRLAKWFKRVQGEKNYLDYQVEESIGYTRKR